MSVLLSNKTIVDLKKYTDSPYPVLLLQSEDGCGIDAALSHVEKALSEKRRIPQKSILKVEPSPASAARRG